MKSPRLLVNKESTRGFFSQHRARAVNAWLVLLCVTVLSTACGGQELEGPFCPVPNGLQGPSLQARVDWFRQRHPGAGFSHRARLWQRTSPYVSRLLGGRVWKGEDAVLAAPDPRHAAEHLDRFPSVSGECWLTVVATQENVALPAALPVYPVRANQVECYSYRDGGDRDDQLEILETALHDGLHQFRCWIPQEARWSRPAQGGSLQDWPGDRWQELAVSPEFQKESQRLDKVWREAEGKLAEYPTYYYAAQYARSLPGAQILELGSNHWPVMPIGVFDANPTADFFTVDCHYPGLWLMEKLLQERRPQWLSRVHRFLADFSQPLPLPDRSIDVAVSTAAFGMGNFPGPSALATFEQVHRVLKPGARFYADCMDLESRPAWLTWAVLQRFRVKEDWGGSEYRALCWESR